MFGTSVAGSSLRCAWNRVVPRGKPFVGIFRSSISTLSRQDPKVNHAMRPRSLRRQAKDVPCVSKRTYGNSAQKSEGNTVLIVGLGALGLATYAVVKTNILSIDGRPVNLVKQGDSPAEVPVVGSEIEEQINVETELQESGEGKEDVSATVETIEDETSENDEEKVPSLELVETPEVASEQSAEVSAEETVALDVSTDNVASPSEDLTESNASIEEEVTEDATAPSTEGAVAAIEVSSDETSVVGPSEIQTVEVEPAVVESEKEGTVEGEGEVSTTETEAKSGESAEMTKQPAVDSNETKEGKAEQETKVQSAVQVNEQSINIKDLPQIPTYVPYVIIGGGTASHAACRSIRRNDPTAKILVIGEEEVLPYMRPPLSKELWFSEDEEAADTLYFKQWNGKRRSVFFEEDTYYVKPQLLPIQENGGIAVMTGHKVVSVDPIAHKLHLKHGEELQYDKLLLATGGHPRSVSLFENSSDELKSKVTLFRTVADYRKLDRLVRSLDSVAIIGGGFLGSELACALGSKGKKIGMEVSQIYHESGNMGKVLPTYLSEWTTKKVQNEGVKMYQNAELVSAELTEDGKVSMALNNGEKVDASHVIVCVGIDPNTELAASAGLEIDPEFGGFRVNSELQARSDIWVAGDAACFYDEKLGRRRVEHHDHAVVSGRLAGENMTGGKRSYLHQSMFWSDLGPEVGYEAIGLVDNTLDTVGVWAKATKGDSPKAVVEATGESLRSQTEESAEESAEESEAVPEEIPKQEELSEDFGKGVVFYLKNEVVVGVLLWNVFNKMPVARRILKEGKKQDSLVELAKLFNIHE